MAPKRRRMEQRSISSFFAASSPRQQNQSQQQIISPPPPTLLPETVLPSSSPSPSPKHRKVCFSPLNNEYQQNQKREQHDIADTNSNVASQGWTYANGLTVNVTGEAAERFAIRNSDKFDFLFKDCRDISGKRPENPGYDPRTLYLPKEFLKGLSGGQRQWWEFKSQHMDKVLFFKMGKFYEMFEMDAHVGVQELDLQYMKGEQPHCGFPEKNYSEYVGKLARRGYKVLVVEQVETPDQLEQRRRETGSKDKVVKREICAVVTKGTMIEDGILETCLDSAMLLSITERNQNSLDKQESGCSIGVCMVDASTSKFILGQFLDDSSRTRLRSLMSEIRPVELIKPDSMLSKETEEVLRNETRNPLVNTLIPGKEFWDAEYTLLELKKMFESFTDISEFRHGESNDGCLNSENGGLPEVVYQFVSSGESGNLAVSAFGGCLSYLRTILLDRKLLKFAKFEILPCSDYIFLNPISKECKEYRFAQDNGYAELYMVLDSTALDNLEIFENSQDCSSSGTLFSQIDHCATAFGRRLLKKWLARPLKCVREICERQHAIAELKGVLCDSAVKFQKELARLPDMERVLARLFSHCADAGRNVNKVVFYEDAAKHLLQQFLVALRGCHCLIKCCQSFLDNSDDFKSPLLQRNLTIGGQLPHVREMIKNFELAFDWSEAEKTGRIIPSADSDYEYLALNGKTQELKAELEQYLENQRRFFGNKKEISYVTMGKNHYVLEIPESLLAKVPQDFEVHSSRKGFQRFLTPTIEHFVQALGDVQEKKDAYLKGVLQNLIKKFCCHHNTWRELVNVVAELDVLINLAFASNYFDGPICTPVFEDIPNSNEKDASPYIHAKMLGHPLLSTTNGSNCFVSNNVYLGRKHPSFLLITGPNMGGKSTLLRQVCLATILAQVGADVPAEEFELTPVDRIFVRMGAKDHIMTGQSTFLAEMEETAAMLLSATRDSLIALDELGRGTSTSDGQAIAHAVLDYLAHHIGCRGMFSTHYHHLAIEYQDDPAVRLCHMACKVGEIDGGLQEVMFLYKLLEGACPKSYGVNVARLAGMPDGVLKCAAKRSAEFESSYGALISKGSGGLSLKMTKSLEEFLEEIMNIVKRLSLDSAAGNMLNLFDIWQRAHRKLSLCECLEK